MSGTDPKNQVTSTAPFWDMSQERAFMETLLGQRFNFLLVFFSFVVAGGINAKDDCVRLSILSLGAFITLFLTLAVARTQHKFNIIFEELRKDPTHPASIADRAARGCSVRNVIGYVIPFLCSFSLITVTAVAWWHYCKSAS